ncbi:hypothetical protein [Natronobacterium gregoryi]|uniref:Uncharacterized protein n=2 Tax=Natronobacterium gregoryi TaxID=44930 RepID=L0AEC3_NATGS|nr:hypothetical protein [Natronobacterium gregoryi]AFZ72171.1 hypothetical protein Natgr_0938 [Natronobacterium gregoryi SP2]ELY63055.1 hypothetical protein C490_16571 [Natronobacterium gregoryi SP2]PLK20115.1 hypothetical protein CYV19_11215 [Natronobacterium gregoryi SP2]SFJ32838.1 hypothetical protein SAMN05443661_12234 [Natronobacterium gregoryi]
MAVLSTEDEGKFLMDVRGEQIGIVTEVDPVEQVAYVDPDPSLTQAWLQSLGRGDAGEDDLEIPAENVETVTDSEIRVNADLSSEA